MLNAYRSGRIPHAWLIGGAQGIGKATLAYRMARFVLANGDPLAPSVQQAETLALDPDNPVARQITADAHGGLLMLERGLNDRGVMRTVITVDETRETISFFGSTARWTAGGSASSTPSTSSIRTPPMRCSRSSRSRRSNRCSSCQPFAGARVADDPVALPQVAAAPARDRDVIRAAIASADIAPDDPALARPPRRPREVSRAR